MAGLDLPPSDTAIFAPSSPGAARSWWRLLPAPKVDAVWEARLSDVATLLVELGEPTELAVWIDLGPAAGSPLISVRGLSETARTPDLAAEEFGEAARELGLPIELSSVGPGPRSRLVSLAARDHSRAVDLRVPPLHQLRSLLPLGLAEGGGGLALEVVVRAEPVGPATIQDVEALNRELGAYWGVAKHASPAVRGRLTPLIRRSRALMDECAGLTMSVILHGSEAPGWFVRRCLERRLGRDLKLDVAWVDGAARWFPARADTLRLLLGLGAAW